MRLIIINCLLLLISCNSSKKNTSKNNNENGNPTINKDQKSSSKSETTQEDKTYTLIYSFISKGEGIDFKVQNKLIEYISEFEKRYNSPIIKKVINWGREGETDYCFDLQNISSSTKDIFIKETKTIINNSELVFIYENSKPKNK